MDRNTCFLLFLLHSTPTPKIHPKGCIFCTPPKTLKVNPGAKSFPLPPLHRAKHGVGGRGGLRCINPCGITLILVNISYLQICSHFWKPGIVKQEVKEFSNNNNNAHCLCCAQETFLYYIHPSLSSSGIPSPLAEPFSGQGLVSHHDHQGLSSLVLPHLFLSINSQKCALCSPTSGLPHRLLSPTPRLVSLPGQGSAEACFPQEVSLCLNGGQRFPRCASSHPAP